MQLWILSSFGNAILSTIFTLSSKYTEEIIHPDSYSSYILLIATIITILFNSYQKNSFLPNKFSIIAGIAQGFTMIFLNKSLQLVNNPGLSMSIFRSQSLLTAILSYFLFNSIFNKFTSLGILTMIIGVYLTTFKSDTKKIVKKTNNNRKWAYYAGLGGIAISVKDIVTKYALSYSNMKLTTYLISQLGIGAIISFIYQYYQYQEFKLIYRKNKGNSEKKHRKSLIFLLISALIFMLYCGLTAFATKSAPNPGYPKAIDSFGIIFTVLLSKYIFKNSEITHKQWFGITMIIIGVFIICLFGS